MSEINFVQGDIVTSPAGILVNPVDCSGAMTDGPARRFKNVYPEVHREYRDDCHDGRVRPGTVRLLRGRDGKLIANLTVRDTPGTPCRAELVGRGMSELRRIIVAKGIDTVAIPEIGASGSLDRETVNSTMRTYLDVPHLKIEVYRQA